MATEYFKQFPNINVEGRDLVDITKQIQFRNNLTDQSAIFDPYIIREGDTPDIAAYNFYGSPYYEWIILLFNNIVDPFYDWILHSDEIEEYINQKYGNKRNEVHHYYDEKTGYIIRQTGFTQGSQAIPVSNEQYEINENEKKREILILKEDFVPQIEEELKDRL